MQNPSYADFISAKILRAENHGFDLQPDQLHPSLYPHQRDIVLWALQGGRRAIFASFGLGKTRIAIEIARQIIAREGGKALFVAPLGVRQEFTRKDGPAMGCEIKYVRNMEEVAATTSPYVITNYERIRDGHIDPSTFTVALLDEASTLRSTGSNTFDVSMEVFTTVKYKYVFTATPSPNRYLELINYAHFLGVMDRGQALTRFFKRDSTKAGNLTLYPHKEREFWFWLCSWSVMLYLPSDLGYSDEGYELPPLQVVWHEIPADHTKAWEKADDSGQRYLLAHEAMGIIEGAQEKRESLPQRIEKAKEIIGDDTSTWLIWHHLEREREAIERAFPSSVSVYGSLDLETREQRVMDFSDGKIDILNTKPELSGSGCNFQRFCHKNLFLGINYDFNDFIQAIHRTYRFLQKETVEVHIIHTETERAIVAELKKKWAKHIELQQQMREIVTEHGLQQLSAIQSLSRSADILRKTAQGKSWKYINNDCVRETATWDENTIDLICTSIPFSNHYEYTPNYLDFGHTDNDAHFFAQLDYLIPNLLNILKPGRIAAIHVKDRILYGSRTGTGFSTSNPFHAKTTFAFMQHGFEYMGMAVLHTDVVSENNQTYRLTHGEMLKDSTKMGFGSPEFLLVFRKPQTNKDRAYADTPVTKDAAELGRWQIDASANWRSSGNRMLPIADIIRMANSEDGLKQIRKQFRQFYQRNIYNYHDHVQLATEMDAKGKLPKKFALLDPPIAGEHADTIWEDISRMNTLNMNQQRRKQEAHVCPLQLDLIERVIHRWSNKGETVFDPFAGISSVPYMAVKMGRYGIGTELNPNYWQDGCAYLREAEALREVPTLFDVFNAIAA